MTRRSPLFALALAATTLAAPNAFAEATEEGAAAIRDGLQSWLDRQFAASGATAEDFQLDGELTVTPEGDAYRALVPPIELYAPDGTIRMAEIPVDVVPMENGWYETSFVLPEVTLLRHDRTVEGRVTIGEQSAVGVFAPEAQMFMSLDIEARDLVLLPVEEGLGSLRVDRLVYDTDYEETSDGIYDLPGSFVMEGLAIDDLGSGMLIRLGSLEIDFASTGTVLAEWAKLMEGFNTISSRAGEISDPAAAGMMADLMEETGTLVSSMSISVGFHDFFARTPEGTFTAPLFTTGGYVSGLDTPRAELGFTVEAPEYAVDAPQVDPFARLFPTARSIDIALVDLPTDPLERLAIGWLRTIAQPAADPSMMLGAMGELAGPDTGRLEIREIAIANEISAASLSGEVRPDAASMLGVTGDGAMTITDLGELIAEVQAIGAFPEAGALLTYLRGMGTPTTTADGGIVHSYDIQLTADARLLLNGNEVNYSIVGAGGPGPADAAGPAYSPKIPSAPAQEPAYNPKVPTVGPNAPTAATPGQKVAR
ncbi:hypothetical protein [Inquilinus sp. CAU 1745]|uniref:hypothetical protein n=1 Tax=Inquilinus sp. CAU 1745 TaxID=3140369 RepID=UPI00325B72FE